MASQVTQKIQGKSPKQWVANHEKMHDAPQCQYGHFGCSCSSKPYGPCLNEMLSLIETPESE